MIVLCVARWRNQEWRLAMTIGENVFFENLPTTYKVYLFYYPGYDQDSRKGKRDNPLVNLYK